MRANYRNVTAIAGELKDFLLRLFGAMSDINKNLLAEARTISRPSFVSLGVVPYSNVFE